MSEVNLSATAAVEEPKNADRRAFLKRASIGSAVIAGSAVFGGVLKAAAASTTTAPKTSSGLTGGDREILIAAEIAEALAVTTYSNIINTAPFFNNLESDDQGYLKNALQEEMSHYALEQSATGRPSPFTTFYYPPDMFANAQTTLNILVTLEDAFIAAYLVGVRRFSTPDLRVTAARIMGIESDHRTLAVGCSAEGCHRCKSSNQSAGQTANLYPRARSAGARESSDVDDHCKPRSDL